VIKATGFMTVHCRVGVKKRTSSGTLGIVPDQSPGTGDQSQGLHDSALAKR
jgi:hypothetical protein